MLNVMMAWVHRAAEWGQGCVGGFYAVVACIDLLNVMMAWEPFRSYPEPVRRGNWRHNSAGRGTGKCLYCCLLRCLCDDGMGTVLEVP
jgi:hypothetical protein